jgi:ActR/RegA family two-component response regulator
MNESIRIPLDPSLLVVGGDAKRLQWLNHHVTSHWPSAQVTTSPAGGSIGRLIEQRERDAVVLLIDFTDEPAANRLLAGMRQWLQRNPRLFCIVLAEHGNELCAVAALKSGARDYLPLATMTRDSLLAAIETPYLARKALQQPALPLVAPLDLPSIEVPGYAIMKQIASSNFSSVFLARSERLRRNVVVKAITRGVSARERDDAERFQREYEIISSIEHRAIAEIYDFGTLPEHQYLAMEYFPCGDLRDRLRNPLSVPESLYYLRSIAEALRVIHVVGILHRDLKPANVMLREDNAPVLIDFGLARRTMDDGEMTGVGQVLGSPYYISPEQVRAERADCRTDLYSLGVMFYEMLTGEKPYLGRSVMEIMAQHTRAPIPRLVGELAAQQGVLDRLMAKALDARYASADALLADLEV